MAIMRAFAADFNAYVEPLRDADSAGWTPTNSVATSNHLNGTAMDLNWNSHPFRILNAGFTSEQIGTIRDLLDFYEDTIWWGNDWNEPRDAMHFQMGYDSYGNDHTADFIARKIRADGYSTFRRGATTVLTVPLTPAAGGRWTSPSPAWAHLITRESGGNPTIIQQIHDVNSGGNEAEGLFQITPATWRAHNGTDFAASPRQATPQQQAIVAARILIRNPSGSDWGAGLPGREDAHQLMAGLTPTTDTQEDELSAEAERMIRELHAALLGPQPSRSALRTPGEATTFTVPELVRNIDGLLHPIAVEDRCELGDPRELARCQQVANNPDPARTDDAKMATAILNKIAAQGVVGKPTGPMPGVAPSVPVPQTPPYVPPEATSPAPPSGTSGTTSGINSGLAALQAQIDTAIQALAKINQ